MWKNSICPNTNTIARRTTRPAAIRPFYYSMFVLLVLQLLIAFCSSQHHATIAQDYYSNNNKNNNNKRRTATTILDELSGRELREELSKMSLDELEDACTQRGFELITDEIDPNTGYPLVHTKEDYQQAAWQCVTMATVTEHFPNPNDTTTMSRNNERAAADVVDVSRQTKGGGPFWVRVLKRVLGDNVLIRFIQKIGNKCRAALEDIRKEALSDKAMNDMITLE